MSNYVPIRVSTLRGDQKISFDAYVRVAGKYILYCREGDSFEGERLDRLISKRLLKMYIRPEQAPLYDKYIKENVARAYDASKGANLENRAQIIQGAIQACAEDLMEDLENEALYSITQEASARFFSFLKTEPEALKAIIEIKNEDYNVAHHGVNVSAVALAIAEEMGVAEERPMQMASLSTACLMHDLEHTYTPVTLSVPEEKLSSNERALYSRHCVNGAERIKEIHYYDKLIQQIVLFHDEKIDGSGALGKKEKELDPIIFIAATANIFDHLITQNKMTPKEALKNMLVEKMGILPLSCLKALQNVLKKTNLL